MTEYKQDRIDNIDDAKDSSKTTEGDVECRVYDINELTEQTEHPLDIIVCEIRDLVGRYVADPETAHDICTGINEILKDIILHGKKDGKVKVIKKPDEVEIDTVNSTEEGTEKNSICIGNLGEKAIEEFVSSSENADNTRIGGFGTGMVDGLLKERIGEENFYSGLSDDGKYYHNNIHIRAEDKVA